MTALQIRPIVLAILAVLSATGWLSPEMRAVIDANSDAVLAGVLALWSLVAFLRNRKEGREVVPNRVSKWG